MLEAIVGVVASDIGTSIAACIDKIGAEGFRITHLETRTGVDKKGGQDQDGKGRLGQERRSGEDRMEKES